MTTPAGHARAIGKLRSRPRVYGGARQTVTAMLTDEAWIVRKRKQQGSIDGSPRTAERDFGPWPARLSEASRSERREAAKFDVTVTHIVLLQSTMPPLISDYIDIRVGGLRATDLARQRFRVIPQEFARRAEFGDIMVWSVQLAKLEEH
jgi:hypothetical protein